MFLESGQAAFLARHNGVVSRSEALSESGLGLSRGQLDRLIAAGVLLIIHPGTYRLAAAPDTWQAKLRAAAVSCDGVASHRAAAELWRLDGFSNGAIDVTVWQSSRPRRKGARVHRSTQMHLAGVTEIDGIATTSAARTLLDLFAILGPKRREQALDAFLRQDLGDLADLYDIVTRHSVQGRNGVGVLRRTLDATSDTKAIPDSRWNRMVGQLLVDHGLPCPAYEHEVRGIGGSLVGRVDLAFPARRLGIELDSMRWHLNRDSFIRDPRRRNRLQLCGWTILNFTWPDYADTPEQLVATVRAALTQAI